MADFTPEALAAIDKVKKLLALANNNPNEHEAAVASAKAMEILEAFNLDMATLSGTREGAGQRQDQKLKGGLYGWQRGLWKACAELHFCMYWSIKGLQKGSAYEHRILGRKENVVGAQVMAEYLQQAVERLAQNWSKERGYNSVFVKPAIAYREGLAERLASRLWQIRNERLAAERRQAAAPSTGGTALVLASVVQNELDLNNDYINGWEPGTTSRRRAEDVARYAVMKARWAAEEAEERQALADPTHPRHAALVARRDAEEAARRDAARREERNARRRKGDGYTYRKLTAQEQRRGMSAFHEGYQKADSVSLDRQIDRTETKRIK